jgi:hypothetical protein
MGTSGRRVIAGRNGDWGAALMKARWRHRPVDTHKQGSGELELTLRALDVHADTKMCSEWRRSQGNFRATSPTAFQSLGKIHSQRVLKFT